MQSAGRYVGHLQQLLACAAFALGQKPGTRTVDHSPKVTAAKCVTNRQPIIAEVTSVLHVLASPELACP